ncbi:MAG: GNAT family N-acetyltransferase [Aminipila sp.]
MNIEIREMRNNDWPFIAEIYQKGIETNIATFQSRCPTFEQWDQTHLKNCRLVLLLCNIVVGWAALTPVSNRCVYAGVAEVSIYLSPNQQRKGLATQLLKELIYASEKAGIWTLQSGIMQDNYASIRLHEKCGFRMVGYRERIGRDQLGKWRNTVLMERRSSVDMEKGDECLCNQK